MTRIIKATMAALVGLALCPCAFAASYSFKQIYTPPATGASEADISTGISVSVDGDLAVVAALETEQHAGRIRTYRRTAGVWTLDSQVLSISGDTPPSLSLGGVASSGADFEGATMIVTANFSDSGTPGTMRIYGRSNNRWVEEQNLFSSSVHSSAAIDGNIAVVGSANASSGRGSVRALVSDGSGNWTWQVLTPQVTQVGARFGESVAIVAGMIVVGAPGEDVVNTSTTVTEIDAGAAYVFTLTGNTWTQEARLVEPNADLADNHQFGAAVAVSGANAAIPDRMLIASVRGGGGLDGRVRSYTRSGTAWTPRTVLSTATPSTQDGYGCSLSLDGDWAAIGMCGSSLTDSNAGAVEVVRFSSSFQSVLSRTVRTDAQGERNDEMGTSVSIDRSGPMLMVGAPFASTYGHRDSGVVLIGRGGDGGDSIPRTIRGLDLGPGLTGAGSGNTVVDGDTMVLGALGEDVGIQAGRGAVHIYQRNAGGSYVYGSRLLAPDGAELDYFGLSMALRGDSLLVGAPFRGVQGLSQAGTVYAFRRVNGNWNLEAQLLPPMPMDSGIFGVGMAFDGTTAVICEANEDRAWVYTRSGAGVWTQPQVILHRCRTPVLIDETLFLNDFLADLGNAHVGKVTRYTRSGGIWQAQETLTGNSANQRFGYDIAAAGDLLAVTSIASTHLPVLYRLVSGVWLPEGGLVPNDVGPSSSCWSTAIHNARAFVGCASQTGGGAVYVFEKSGSSWVQTQKLVHQVASQGDNFGDSLTLHSDGTLFVAAPADDLDFEGQGSALRFAEPSALLFGNGFEQ